jgi:hypothetical protein
LGIIGSSARVLSGHMPRPRKPTPQLLADRLHLFEVAPGLGAGLVQVLERRARQLELAGRFQADAAVRPRQRDDLAAFLDGFPADIPAAESGASRMPPGSS